MNSPSAGPHRSPAKRSSASRRSIETRTTFAAEGLNNGATSPGQNSTAHRRSQPWLRERLGLISKKSKLAETIRYALARWEGPTRFLDAGRIGIDSNTVQRSIRPIALNRKNALFAGSDGGWAVIASLIETCKLNGVDPNVYLADALVNNINGHLNSRSTISCHGPT